MPSVLRTLTKLKCLRLPKSRYRDGSGFSCLTVLNRLTYLEYYVSPLREDHLRILSSLSKLL